MSRFSLIRDIQHVLASATVPHCPYRMREKLLRNGPAASVEQIFAKLEEMERMGLASSVVVKSPGESQKMFVASQLARSEMAASELLGALTIVKENPYFDQLCAEAQYAVEQAIAKATGGQS